MRRTINVAAAICAVAAATGIPAGFASEEDAAVETFDGKRLGATWTLPDRAPTASIVIVQGSGNVGRDGDVSGPFLGSGYRGGDTRLSRQLADALARAGYASLRYDKRGFEDSNELSRQVHSYLVRDLQAAMSAAKARFADAPLFLLGFSEGALVSVYAQTDPSTNQRADALFLLGLPSRPIDETLEYQFTRWPVELLGRRIDRDRDETLSSAELASVTAPWSLPLFGADWRALDRSGDGALSVIEEVTPAYAAYYAQVRQLLEQPQFRDWYQELRSLPAFPGVASQASAPVYIYHGTEDAQTRASWVVEDTASFPNRKALRLFEGLGHCFSPMDGGVGEIKTAGPTHGSLLDALISDLTALRSPAESR